MPRLPVRILTSAPQGTTNPAAVTGRSVAPANVRTLGPAQPRQQFADFQSNRVQSSTNQALGRTKARYDSDQQVVPAVSFFHGTQQAVRHGLGRAWVGCMLMTPIGAHLSYQVAHHSDLRMDAFSVLVTCLNSLTADVVIW
jgi:hypothetical protein